MRWVALRVIIIAYSNPVNTELILYGLPLLLGFPHNSLSLRERVRVRG
jgi:hypothetical protein